VNLPSPSWFEQVEEKERLREAAAAAAEAEAAAKAAAEAAAADEAEQDSEAEERPEGKNAFSLNKDRFSDSSTPPSTGFIDLTKEKAGTPPPRKTTPRPRR
jgi:type II secretory pathway pseudopilin PulG